MAALQAWVRLSRPRRTSSVPSRLQYNFYPSYVGYGGAEAALDREAVVLVGSSTQDKVDAAVSKLQRAFPSGSVHGHVVNLREESSVESFFTWVDGIGNKGLDHLSKRFSRHRWSCVAPDSVEKSTVREITLHSPPSPTPRSVRSPIASTSGSLGSSALSRRRSHCSTLAAPSR